MARIILTQFGMFTKQPIAKVLVDTTSDFTETLGENFRAVTLPDGDVIYVVETLEEINQMCVQAEAEERILSAENQERDAMLKKFLENQEEMLEIMKYLVKINS